MKLLVYFCGTNEYRPSSKIRKALKKIYDNNNDIVILTVPGCAFYHTPLNRFCAPGSNDIKNANDAIKIIRYQGDDSICKSIAPDLRHDAQWLKSMIFSGNSMVSNVNAYANKLKEFGVGIFHNGSEEDYTHVAVIKGVSDCYPHSLESIILTGFSRGGVLSFIMSKLLQADSRLRSIPVYISVQEPVPGNTLINKHLAYLFNTFCNVFSFNYMNNHMPARSNSLDAGDMRKCSNVRRAIIYVGAYDDAFMCQIVPKFNPATKVQVIVDREIQNHGGGGGVMSMESDMLGFVNCGMGNYSYSEFENKQQIKKYSILNKNSVSGVQGLSMHYYGKSSSKRLRDKWFEEDELRPFFFGDDRALRKLIRSLVFEVRGSTFGMASACKFYNFDRAIEQMVHLNFKSKETIRMLQMIVKESFRVRIGHSRVTNTGEELAKRISLCYSSCKLPFTKSRTQFEKTKYGYIGMAIQGLTPQCDSVEPQIVGAKKVDAKFFKMHMCLRLLEFVDYDDVMIEDKVDNDRFQELGTRLNNSLKNNIPVECSERGVLRLREQMLI
ncbi:MAG: hypothetical protein GY718_10535 [Lentisphaerae bacterium]|nr:hypothetical protein [Lentisphaerota bacterium]